MYLVNKITICLTIFIGAIFLFINTIINLGLFELIGYIISATCLTIIVFKKYIWKIEIIQKLTKIRNIQGIWTGIIKSNYDGKEYKIIEFTIKQSCNKYRVFLKTDQSNSKSEINEIIISETDELILRYIYQNIPKVTLRGKSAIHFGIADLTLKNDELKGEYWTDRMTSAGKNTRGEMCLKKTPIKGNFDLVSVFDIFNNI